ncbi:hypothetical protein [Alishewanella longhuensis]
MQSLWALKLWANAKHTAKRFSLWLYTRVKNLLFYIIRHPIRSIIQFIKIYLLTLLLLMFVAFSLSGIVSAQVLTEDGKLGIQGSEMCPQGGNYAPALGFCFVSATLGRQYRADIKFTDARGIGKSQTEAGEKAAANWASMSSSVENIPDNRCNITITTTATAEYNPSNLTATRTMTTTYNYSAKDGWDPSNCISPPPNTQVGTPTEVIFTDLPESYQCPPESSNENFGVFNLGPYETEEGYNICFYMAEEIPECNCADYKGDSLSTFNDLRAPKGQYSTQNPPQCIQQREYAVGRDEPLTCLCQVSAQKWFSTYGGFKDGVEYEVWSTLPTQQGQPSGTFTGVKCGETDAGPLEPEDNAPKECFTLSNGVKWCWANEDEKCARIDGIMTCESGCGRINGDFVCIDNPDNPTLPDPPEVDDTITDPTKNITDMTKGDFKDVNRGIEARLDVLAQLMQQANNRPGISMADTNRALGDIGNKIDALTDAVKDGFAGQDGEDDEDGGGDEDGGSVTYDRDRLSEFANPNDWEERNFGTVIMATVDQLKETPIFSAINSFFEVSFSAECPIWSTNFTVFNQSFDFTVDQHCSSTMSQIWPWIRAIILLVFSFLAFRVAYE